MKTYGVLKFYLCDFPGIVMYGVAALGIFLQQSIYSYIRVPFIGVTFHAVTLLCIGLTYRDCCRRSRFLPLSLRILASGGLVALCLSVYDLIWGTLYYLVNGDGIPVAAILSTSINLIIILFLDSRRIFLHLKPTLAKLVYLGGIIIGFGGMVYTGFFTQMAAYNLGLASDPNVNWFWMVSKVIVVMFASLLIRTEDRECREPMLVI